MPTLVHRPLAAPQVSGETAARPLVAIAFGTIVTGKEDERRVGKLHVGQGLHQLSEGVVELRDVRAVGPLLPVGDAGVELLIPLGRCDRVMRLVRPHGEEEWLRGIALLSQPADRLLHDERCRIVVGLADGLTVADEVGWKGVARCGVVLRGEPPRVAMVRRLRLVGRIEPAIQVPLADVAGVVASAGEELRQRMLAGPKMDRTVLRDPREHTVAVRCPAGQKRRPRRRTDAACRMAVGQPQTLGGEAIEVWRDGLLVPVAAQFAVAEVVGEKEHDVGPCRYRGFLGLFTHLRRLRFLALLRWLRNRRVDRLRVRDLASRPAGR